MPDGTRKRRHRSNQPKKLWYAHHWAGRFGQRNGLVGQTLNPQGRRLLINQPSSCLWQTPMATDPSIALVRCESGLCYDGRGPSKG